MAIFRRAKEKEVAPPKQNYPEMASHHACYPVQSDFYSVCLEEYGGLLPIHSVRMSFVLPYDH